MITQSLTVKRYGAGSMSHGVYTPGALDETFTVSGYLQPITGEERKVLPEGIRQSAKYKLYCPDSETTLRPVDLATSKDGDIVVHDSRDFRVVQDRDYSIQLRGRVSHRRYILVEEADR